MPDCGFGRLDLRSAAECEPVRVSGAPHSMGTDRQPMPVDDGRAGGSHHDRARVLPEIRRGQSGCEPEPGSDVRRRWNPSCVRFTSPRVISSIYDMAREPDGMPEPVPTDVGSDDGDPAERAPEVSPVEFTGNATEYFGIWLSNTVLAVLTVGIYSAWAKVRRSRYFLGNTIVLGDRLEYHATGVMILKGRLIAVAAVAVYLGIGFVSTLAQTVVAIALIPVYPWVINRAMRFNARMTSWRNVRFDWHGAYWGVTKVYLLWPIVAVLTLGVLAPLAARASREYLANRYALGRERFSAETPLRPYYAALLWTMLFGAALVVVAAGLIAAVLSLSGLSIPDAEFGASSNAGMGMSSWQLALVAAPIIAILPATICFQILTRNIIVNALTLGDAATFRSDLNPLRYLWILLSNFIATVLTAFLMYPWAQVRQYRYQAERITVRPTSALGTFLDTAARSDRAFGEEFGEIQDVGLEF